MNVAGMYSKERLENLQAINATYGRALRVGDAVQLGNEDDPLYPYRGGERPYGRVTPSTAWTRASSTSSSREAAPAAGRTATCCPSTRTSP